MPYGDNSEPVSPVGGIFQNTRRTSIAKHSPAARLRSGADRRYCWRGGRLAQLVERHVYTVDVGGSSPSPPTSKTRDLHDAPRGLAVVVRLSKVTCRMPQACGASPFHTGIAIPLRIRPEIDDLIEGIDHVLADALLHLLVDGQHGLQPGSPLLGRERVDLHLAGLL